MNLRHIAILLFLIPIQITLLKGQNTTVVVEAETGAIGNYWQINNEDSIRFVSVSVNGTEQFQSDSNCVITYNIRFSDSGVYDLYVKLRVNAEYNNNTNFYYANGFGNKSIDTDSSWIMVNNLNPLGFEQSYNFVTGGGEANSGSWKWIKLSALNYLEEPILFEVIEDNLTKTFQIAAGEKGVDIDKFVFSSTNLHYTVSLLEKGETGINIPEGTVLPLAFGHSKFIGNVYSSAQLSGFSKYWNQVTPENAGKWGSVEKTRDHMSWANLDKAYKLAKNNNFPYKHHVLLWGSQQPSWIENLNASEQREEIKEWFNAVSNRYPDIEFIEVVNEPLHAPPDHAGNGGGNYYSALGGSGTSGWDWVIKAFKYARNSFPNTKLMINEYGIVNSTENTDSYIEIIELLKKDTLIDAIGVQAHAFSLNVSPATIKKNLNKLAETGLPIYITELDIDGKTDNYQLTFYQRVFPVFWEHPSVKGITLWGFRPGMWRTEEQAYLINTENNERPALIWLREYVNGTFKKVNAITINAENGNPIIDTNQGTLQLTATLTPVDPTFAKINWSVIENELATIDENGLLTALKNGVVTVMAQATDGFGKTAYFRVTITNQVTVGTNDLFENNKISVFPNPSKNGSFTISGIQNINQIRLLNTDGRLLKNIHTKNQNQVLFHQKLNSGIYLIQMTDGINIFTRKLIID